MMLHFKNSYFSIARFIKELILSDILNDEVHITDESKKTFGSRKGFTKDWNCNGYKIYAWYGSETPGFSILKRISPTQTYEIYQEKNSFGWVERHYDNDGHLVNLVAYDYSNPNVWYKFFKDLYEALKEKNLIDDISRNIRHNDVD